MSTPAPKPITPPLVKIETQYRRFLARRWFDFTWRAAFYVGVVTAFTTAFITRDAATLLVGFVFGLLSFPITLYPILSTRRSLITSRPILPVKSSMVSLFFSSITSPRTLRLIGTYLVFAVGYTTVYCQVIQLGSPSREFGLRTPTQRHPLHLNERFIFLLLGNTLFLTYLALKDVLSLSVSKIPTWPKKKTPFFVAAKRAIVSALESIGIALPGCGISFELVSFMTVYSALFFTFRRTVWYFLLTHSAGILRPFIINFARTSQSNLTWSMVFHIHVLAFSTLAILQLSIGVINIYVTHPMVFDALTKKSPFTPDRYLLTALQTRNSYLLHFTMMEVVRVSHDPVRRRAIFGDISKTPVLTHEIWQELLLRLGQAHHRLVTRNGLLTQQPLKSAIRSPADSHSIALKQGDIFKPAIKHRSTFDLTTIQNVLDGPVQSVPPEPVRKLEQVAKEVEGKAAAQIQDAKKEVMGRFEGMPVGHAVMEETMGWLGMIYTWAGEEWSRRNVETVMPDTMVIVWIIDIFATMAVASLEEDTYGHVQQVLPVTIEAIARLHLATKSLEAELTARTGLLGRAGPPAVTAVKRALAPTIEACERGITRIAGGFGKSITAFRFPPSVTTALNDIVRMTTRQQEGRN